MSSAESTARRQRAVAADRSVDLNHFAQLITAIIHHRTAILSALAMLYAIFAGLRTVGDMDIGWQLAIGRWMVQHLAIPSTDILSYTAGGKEWIYPALSQALLYCFYLIGGYKMLSWAGAAACAGTTAILLRRATATSAFLAMIAVPMIASRTQPRAEMFTEILFAVFLTTLWQFHRTGRGPLWLLPILMLLWVNLHLGFVAGLAMCGAYLFMDASELLVSGTRARARDRMRRAVPWIGAAVAATLLNPWGARIYVAMARQNEINRIHSRWIVEWSRIRLNSSTILDFFAWREPRSGLFWLLAAAAIAVAIAIFNRKISYAIVLAAAIYAVLHAIRLQGVFACLVVVIGGTIISDALGDATKRHPALGRATSSGTIPLLLLAVFFVGIRISDLVSNRYYLRTPATFSVFGTGDSALYPSAAAEFLKREGLPGNILNDYNSGGYLSFALAPQYPDYIDGRSVPFGAELFLNLEKLMSESPDSPDWQREADQRNINTVIVSLDHELAGGLATLGNFCASQNWRPVFVDPFGAIFVRVTDKNSTKVRELQLDCHQVRFDGNALAHRGAAENFRYYLNAGTILIVLDRNGEALEALHKAELIFPDNPFLHYARGAALENLGNSGEAEKELLKSLDLGSDDAAFALARLYDKQGHYPNEARVLEEAANRAPKPHGLYLRLGYVRLAMGDPRAALAAFDRAEKESPFVYEADRLGQEFNAELTEGRRQALHLITSK